MALSDSTIKTYTQPACTLQIVDLSSPSRKQRSIDPQMKFELGFNNLLSKDRQISIGGDRYQLAELHEAVISYVRNLLKSAPEQFTNLLAARTDLASEAVLTTQSSDTVAPNPPEVAIATTETPTPAREIFFQPGDGLSHNLFLGSLATTETGQVIHLSMLQLFDLVTVLDEYAADALAAPVGMRSRRATASTPSTAWASIAAMLLLAVGLTAGLVQLLNRSDEGEVANVPRRGSNGQPILQPLPTPQVSPPDTLPSITSPGTTNPSSIARLPAGSVPQPATVLPGTPLPPPQTTSISPLPGITQAPPIPSQAIPKQSESSISVPRQAAVPETSSVRILPGGITPADTPTPSSPSSEANRDPTGNTKSASSPTAQRIRAAVEGRSPSTLTPPSEPQTTALATTPQIGEVRDYFQQRWTPPAGLSQTLEYSIVLDVDGTIQRIEPLGKAARTYVDRSSMPLIGERFVSPNSSGATPRIRVVLSPDGKVQTFLEPN